MTLDLEPILQCPKCGHAPLQPPQCGSCDARFPVVRGQPVLIDFDDSIFAPETYREEKLPEAQSGSRLGWMLAQVTYGENDVAPGKVARFRELLGGGGRRRVLVVGGGTVGSGAQSLYEDTGLDVVGTDIYPSEHTRLVCDGHKLPFRDASFDGVFIQAVLEHVLEPHRVVAEIHRVLAPDGVVLAETPFLQQVHLGAYDFTRFTFSGHRWLFRRFEQVDAGLVAGPGMVLLWSIAHFLKSMGVGPRLTAIMTLPFSWLRLLDKFARRPQALDGASGVYFLGRKSAQSVQPRQMLDYYEQQRGGEDRR